MNYIGDPQPLNCGKLEGRCVANLGFVSSSGWGSVGWSSGSQMLGFSLTPQVCQLEVHSPAPDSADSDGGVGAAHKGAHCTNHSHRGVSSRYVVYSPALASPMPASSSLLPFSLQHT